MKIFTRSLIVLLAFILAACSTATPSVIVKETIEPTQIPVTPLPTSAKGKATVIGRAISSVTGNPYANEFIRLAEVFYDEGTPHYILDAAFSPGAISDEKGFFVFMDVPPGEYVVTVGEFFSQWKVYKEGDLARIFDIPADQTTDLGVIKVDYQR